MMTQALKVVLSSSRSTGASVSPLLVARTAPEGKEKQRLAMRKQVSFKTLSKLNSEDGVRELAKVWSGSNGDGEDEEEQNDHVSPLQQTRSLLLQKKSVSFRLTKDTTPRPHRLLHVAHREFADDRADRDHAGHTCQTLLVVLSLYLR